MAEQKQLTPAEQNTLARTLIRAKAIPRLQQIFSQTYSSSGAVNLASQVPVVNITPRMVGLVRGFWCKVALTVTNGSGQTANITNFGAANALSQIQFQDLQNNTRIQTPGWHLAFLNTMKGRRPFDGALVAATGMDMGGVGYGANWTQQNQAPASINDSATGTVIMWYYVPLAYSAEDLRGSVYMGVVNATAQLQLYLPTTVGVLNTADSTLAMYTTSGTPASVYVSAATITVYQDYLDQLPMTQTGVVLPMMDLATIYELKQTTFAAITQGQDFPMQYSNFRSFLSTFAVYVNTTANANGRGVGADINYWALRSANFTDIWKCEPGLVALKSRSMVETDFPRGVYYFGSRERPISTIQYGNMELVLNPSSAAASAYCLVGYEDFALVNQISAAGSLPAS